MICTERPGSKLVSAANYTVMSRHQSYDVLSCSTSGDGHSVFIVVIVIFPPDFQCFTQQRSPNGFMYVMGDGLWISYFVGTCTGTYHSQRVASKK